MNDLVPPCGLRCHVEPDRERVTVRPVGELDLATVARVEEPLAELWDAGFAVIVLDLRWLTFIDSTGLRLLIRCAKRGDADGVEVRLVVDPDSVVERVLQIAGLRDVLPIDAEPPSGVIAPPLRG